MIVNLVILLIFCVSNIYSDESEEGKYIDLLPEDEKREFLETVARRILEEVESKDPVQKSVELTDGQLNKHSAYVSKVMKEEEDSLMKKHKNDTNIKKKDVRSDDPALKDTDKKENDEVQIDLTLRHGKSSIRRHDTEKRSVSDTVNITKTRRNLEESTKVVFTTGETDKVTETEATTVSSKIKDDNFSVEIIIEGTENKKSPEAVNQRSNPVNDINIPVQVVYDNAQNIHTEGQTTIKEDITYTPTTTEESKTDGSDYIYRSREENGHNDETRKTVTVMENYDPKKCWSSEESKTTTSVDGTTTNGKATGTTKVVTDCNGKPIKIENTSKWIIVDPPDVTGGIYEQIDMTRSKTTNETHDEQEKIANGIVTTTETSTDNLETVDTTSPLIDKVNSTQVDIPINNTNALKEENKEKTTIGVEEIKTDVDNIVTTSEQMSKAYITSIEPITTTTSATVATVKPEKFEQVNSDKVTTHDNNENTNKPKIVISTTNNRFENIQLKSFGLRIGDVETQMENSKSNLLELEAKYNKNKIKELKVYEIPPDKSLFVTDKPKDVTKTVPKIDGQESATASPGDNVGQPNYVPIYNYSPNNAYFNAYNRLGPNYEDVEGNRNSDLINPNVLRIKADSSISFESRDRTEKKYYFYNSRPFIKKIRSKILLPPSMPRNKKKRYNPEIYLDDFIDTEENSFYKKKKKRIKYVRSKNSKLRKKNKKKKRSKIRSNKNLKNTLPYVNEYSFEVDEKYKAGTLKNHIEAVRAYLSSKNHFGFYEPPYEKMRKIKQRKKKKKKEELPTLNEEKNYQNVDNQNILDQMFEKGNEVVEPKVDEILNPEEDDNTRKEDEDNKPKEDEDNIPKEDEDIIPKEDENIKPKEDEDNPVNEELPVNEAAGEIKEAKRKRKWYMRAKSKKNKQPKTGIVDGFNNKKRQHGIDLDYYFGRTGLDISDFNSDENSAYSESKESSSREGQLTVGSLGSIYYSGSRENYYDYRRNEKNEKKDHASNKTETKKSKFTMKDLILVKNISVAKDVVQNILTMQKLIGINKRSNENNLRTYMTVLSDMIQMDNRALSQYDWLGSAVDIQSALRKLIDLTEQLNDGDFDIHPADWELFKYVFYIYETADLGTKRNSEILRKMLHPPIPVLKQKQDLQLLAKNIMPKPKKQRGTTNVKKYEPYFSLRAQLKVYQEKLKEKQMLLNKVLDFQEFLNSARDNLNDLHDAIKHIGMVSKRKTAKWYKNLKDVYLSQPKKRELLTVLLHLSLNRVVNLLEESAKEGVERSFLSFVRRKRNALKIRRTKEEMLFVLTILRELEADALEN